MTKQWTRQKAPSKVDRQLGAVVASYLEALLLEFTSPALQSANVKPLRGSEPHEWTPPTMGFALPCPGVEDNGAGDLKPIMIIESSDQVPRGTLLKRFLGVAPGSRIERGKRWPAPAGAVRVKSFNVYRYDPDSDANPRLDTYQVDLDDCGPMALDALLWIKNTVDSTLTFRRSCREGVCGSCAMTMDGTNWLACTRFISDLATPTTVYPLANLPVIKDLVSDTTHLFAQYAMIQPWLKSAPPNRRGNGCSRRKSATGLTAITNASCVSAAPRVVPAIGGMVSDSWTQPSCCRRGDGLPTPVTPTKSGSTRLKIHSACTAATRSSTARGRVQST